MSEGDEVDKTKLETLLRSDLLTINDLRDIIDERDLNIKSRRTDRLIEAILADRWTQEEFSELIETLSMKQEETEPKGHYIQQINGIDRMIDRPTHEVLEERLKTKAAVISDDTIEEDGFEIIEVDSDHIEGIHWSQNTSYVLGPFNQLRSRESLYNTPFKIDLEHDLVFLGADRFGKARGLSSELRDLSIELESVGHHDLMSSKAANVIDDFVDELESSLDDIAESTQAGVEDFSSAGSSDRVPLVEIDTVNIQIESGEIKEARIGGRTDIFDNETVQKLVSERGGKIAQIKGEMIFKGEFFKFHVGYNEVTGRLMVKKKGRAKGDVELVQEAYDFLYELYDEYFISV